MSDKPLFDRVLEEAWTGDPPQDAYGDIDCGDGVMLLVDSGPEHDTGHTKVPTQERMEMIEKVVLLGKWALGRMVAEADASLAGNHSPELAAILAEAEKLRRAT